MNKIIFVSLAVLMVVASCSAYNRQHPCIQGLLACVQDRRVVEVTSNPYGVSQRQACDAANFLLNCVKVCPADFLRQSGLQANIDQLTSASRRC